MDGTNLYEYVRGNPTNRLDPEGLKSKLEQYEDIIKRWVDLAGKLKETIFVGIDGPISQKREDCYCCDGKLRNEKKTKNMKEASAGIFSSAKATPTLSWECEGNSLFVKSTWSLRATGPWREARGATKIEKWEKNCCFSVETVAYASVPLSANLESDAEKVCCYCEK